MKFPIIIAILFALNGALASPSTRMVNGYDVEHLPSFTFITPNGPDHVGGGHLISTLHVLTGASIIRGYTQWIIGLGYNMITFHTNVISYSGVVHPAFDSETGANDIGILFLSVPLTISAAIQPIPLVDEDMGLLPFENEQGSVFGYGSSDYDSLVPTNHLRTIHPRVFTSTRCSEYFPNHNNFNSFCALDNLGANICHGDAGGGFILTYRRAEILVGIATNINNCQTVLPSPYTRIYAYRQWIRDITSV